MEQAQRFRNLVDGLEAVVWEADARTLQFTFVGQQAEKLLGYPADCWLAEPDFWSRLVLPEDRGATIAAIRRAALQGRPLDIEYRAVTAAGRPFWLRHLMHPTGGGRSPTNRVQGLLIDVTSRKRAETREHFLAEASGEIGRTLEYETSLKRVAEHAVEALADAVLIEIVEDDELVRWIAGIAATPGWGSGCARGKGAPAL